MSKNTTEPRRQQDLNVSREAVRTKFLVRLSDQEKEAKLSLTNHSENSCLNVIKRNQISNLFGRLEESKNESNKTSESGIPRNLFGSRLEDARIEASMRKNTTEQLAEFQKDPRFEKIKKIVDSLKKKGVLGQDGELNPNAFVDDNCARDDPVLSAMIEAANCVNKNWVNIQIKFLEKIS